MTSPAKYGNRNVPKMIRGWRRLADACRDEGTPAVQAALDDVEQYIDYAFRNDVEGTTEMTVKPTATRRRVEQLQAENDALNATISQNLQRQQELEIENDALKTTLVDMQQEVTDFMKVKEEELASANRLILSLMEDLALRIKGGK